MILCIGTTPACQHVMVFRKVTLNAVNRAIQTLDGAAGKSVNVAKVIKVLGGKPVATGFLGGDRGDYIKAELIRQGVQVDFVSIPARTRQCITVIDESARMQTELVEESPAIDKTAFAALSAIIDRHLRQCKAVVMSGTIAPGGASDFYYQCVRMANQSDVISVVDAQGAPLLEALKAKPGLVKPNRAELAATVGHELPDELAILDAMRELRDRGAQHVVVTAGKDPLLAFDGQNYWRITAPTISVVNPIGSGDAFTAGMIWRWVQGDRFEEACRWGCATGTANALTPMAGEVCRKDVERLAQETRIELIHPNA